MSTQWPLKRLGEVAVLNPTEPALSPDAQFVPMDAVRAGSAAIQYTEPRGSRSGARARSGDILYARITPCLQNGKVAIVPDSIDRCGGSTEFIVVRPGEHLLVDYLYFWLTSQSVREEATGLMVGATGRQRLGAEDLASLKILLPPLAEQQRIVARLDTLQSVASDVLRCRVEADRKLAELSDRFLDEILEQSGPRVRLAEVCSIRSVLVDPRDQPYASMIHVGGGNIETVTGLLVNLRSALEEGLISGKYEFSRGDVLYSKIRPYLRKVALPEFGGLCSADVYPLTPYGNIRSAYLHAVLRSRRFTEYAVDGSARAGMPKVNREHLFEFAFPLPNLVNQDRFIDRLEGQTSVLTELAKIRSKQQKKVSDLRRSVLEAAFRGEL